MKTIYSADYSTLIDLLTAERKRLGLSQSEVALNLEMAQSDVSKIENQERRIDVLEFKKLLTAYRVSENPILNSQIKKFLGLSDEY